MNDKGKQKSRAERKAYGKLSRAQRANDALYDRIFRQQEQYGAWLCSLPPEEVLDNVYEYLVREDILILTGRRSLPCEQARALLRLPDPAGAIFSEYAKQETDRMENVTKAIRRCAEREMHKRRAD